MGVRTTLTPISNSKDITVSSNLNMEISNTSKILTEAMAKTRMGRIMTSNTSVEATINNSRKTTGDKAIEIRQTKSKGIERAGMIGGRSLRVVGIKNLSRRNLNPSRRK